jgi:hypothetical protein
MRAQCAEVGQSLCAELQIMELLLEKRTCASKTRIRVMNDVEKFVSVI